MDPRIIETAKTLVHYSTQVKKGDRVFISLTGPAGCPLVKALIREVYDTEALPFLSLSDESLDREIMLGVQKEQLDLEIAWKMARLEKMDVVISIRGTVNPNEQADVPTDKALLFAKNLSRPITERVVDHTRWVVVIYPSSSMAQAMGTSLEAAEDLYFRVCTLDYAKMSKAMDPLVALMEKTDRVHITGEGTDLSFSIKGIPAIKCDGTRNVPDGEVYTAPVRDSVNGVIHYNVPSIEKSSRTTFDDVTLTFEKGQIIKATANNTAKINEVFDIDPGARYVGEFALGLNPCIETPMKNTLFDEKIAGSFHFTPGRAYKTASNGNTSTLHWDLVSIQNPEYGGGEIFFDEVLIRKDGRFVLPELESLNPENLL